MSFTFLHYLYIYDFGVWLKIRGGKPHHRCSSMGIRGRELFFLAHPRSFKMRLMQWLQGTGCQQQPTRPPSPKGASFARRFCSIDSMVATGDMSVDEVAGANRGGLPQARRLGLGLKESHGFLVYFDPLYFVYTWLYLCLVPGCMRCFLNIKNENTLI